MTFVQCIVAYAVCWWMVLFMVLPSGVEPEKNPGLGHVPSAPRNPQLKRKFKRTTLLAIVPTVAIYLLAMAAKAEEGIYHVGGGCKPLAAHKPGEDVAVRDGYGAGGKEVAPANLESYPVLGDMKSVNIPLKTPTEKYLKEDQYNADMSESFAETGTLEIGLEGSTKLNGHSVSNQEVFDPKCASETEKK